MSENDDRYRVLERVLLRNETFLPPTTTILRYTPSPTHTHTHNWHAGGDVDTEKEAFDILGFSQDEKDDIFSIVAAVMHLGTMKFKQRGREEQAEAEGAAVRLYFCSTWKLRFN